MKKPPLSQLLVARVYDLRLLLAGCSLVCAFGLQKAQFCATIARVIKIT